MAEEDLTLPTDAFVEILLRLPTSARRRFRLVCKRWRDIIDERTPERQARSQILAFISDDGRSHALVFDKDKDGCPRHEWTYNSSFPNGNVYMVSTCNGLICLQDIDHTADSTVSTITVANPITGDTMMLPPVPTASDSSMSRGRYGFGYHPTTGQYKVVHVTSGGPPRRDTVHVFTLGDLAWREPFLSGNCYPFGRIVTVDGSTYWIALSTDWRESKVMALDLKDERLMSLEVPPAMWNAWGIREVWCNVTNVHGRLGVAIEHITTAVMRVEVWVLEGGAREAPPRWSQSYTLIESGAPRNSIVAAPHLTHGQYVLSISSDWKRMYRLKLGDSKNRCGKGMQLRPSEGAELILCGEMDGVADIFAYVETREPLPSI
ncbi:hypothetical protein EJB05_48531, partial [Eragrostis curvula]